MFLLRRAIVLSKYAVNNADSHLQNKAVYNKNTVRLLASKKKKNDPKKVDPRKMVDPKRVLSFDDVLRVINEPHKVLIDVRNPDEVCSTGMIPSSINIPLCNVKHTLECMSEEEFYRMYNRCKPSSEDELVFYCRSGTRSSQALDEALKLGYTNSKTYLGSWTEWSKKVK